MDFISNGFSYGNLRGQAFIQTCKPTGTQSIMRPEAPFIKSISRGLFENRKPLKTGAFERFFQLFPLIQSLHLKKPYKSALLAHFCYRVPHIVPHFCGLFCFFKSYKFLVPLYLPTKRKGQLFFPIAGPDETSKQEQEITMQIFNLHFKASSRLYNRFCSISCGFPLPNRKTS